MTENPSAKAQLEELCEQKPDNYWKEQDQKKRMEWGISNESHYSDVFKNLYSVFSYNLYYARKSSSKIDETEARDIVADIQKTDAAFRLYFQLLEQYKAYCQKETQTIEGAFPELKKETFDRVHYINKSKELLEANDVKK